MEETLCVTIFTAGWEHFLDKWFRDRWDGVVWVLGGPAGGSSGSESCLKLSSWPKSEVAQISHTDRFNTCLCCSCCCFALVSLPSLLVSWLHLNSPLRVNSYLFAPTPIIAFTLLNCANSNICWTLGEFIRELKTTSSIHVWHKRSHNQL